VTIVKTPTLWRYTAREMQRRPGRTLLTLLGIVIGVAASVAIAVTVQTTRRAHRDMFEALTGRASLEIVAEGLGGFDETLPARLESVPGLLAAVPVIQIPAAVIGKSGAVPVLALGVDPDRDQAARAYFLRSGRKLAGTDGLLLEAGFAEAQQIALGQSARLLTSTGFTNLPVVGLLEPRGAAAFNGGAVAFMPLAVAQRLFGLTNRINSIQLVLADGASPATVEAEVLKLLPDGLTVQPPASRGEMGRAGLVSTEQGLNALSVSALVAGAFVILNAFLMNLGERRQQLAILRALGATRSQVTRLLLREAVLVGIAGTVLGIGTGLALSIGLNRVMEQFLTVKLPELRWGSVTILSALIVGPGMALAATYVPARRAGRRSPLEDLLHKRGKRTEEGQRWPGYVGLVLMTGVLLFAYGIVSDWFPSPGVDPYLAPALALFLVGSVLVIPLILGPLGRLAGLIVKPLLGGEGTLALRQLLRHQSRTALTVGVVMVAVVFAIGFGQSLLNNMKHVHEWFDKILVADFYIRGGWPDVTISITTAALPESLGPELAAFEGVERVSQFSYIMARAAGRQVVIMAYQFPDDKSFPPAWAIGDPRKVQRGLAQGEVVLGTTLAKRMSLGVGDDITVQTRHGPQALRVAGTVSEYIGGGLALYMDWTTATRLFEVPGVHTYLVNARPGASAGLGARLRDFCAERGYQFQSITEVRETFDKQMEGFLGSVWVLLSLVFVVASLGIVNTLTMNVLEQTRELGVLRAIGMRRFQVAKMIISQALALSVISLIPGAFAGIALAYLVNLTTYPLTGQPVQFSLSPVHVAGCCLAGLVISVLAAFIPARRAARLQVVRALQYE
jgi:putative ABC transport system permease protein